MVESSSVTTIGTIAATNTLSLFEMWSLHGALPSFAAGTPSNQHTFTLQDVVVARCCSFSSSQAPLSNHSSRCGRYTVRVVRQNLTLSRKDLFPLVPMRATSGVPLGCPMAFLSGVQWHSSRVSDGIPLGCPMAFLSGVQWHSSRVSTLLTGSHCNLRPHTKDRW
jgi:hypothetical protein